MATTETAAETAAEDRVYSQAEVDKMIDRKVNNLVSQIRERDEKLTTYERTRQEEEQRQLTEQQRFRELAESLQGKLSETEKRYQEEIASRDRSLSHEKIRRELASSGLTDEIQHLGLIAKFEALEERPTIHDWIEALKAAEPHRFAPAPQAPTGRSTGSVGTIRPQTETLEARLQSSDTRVKQAALKERLMVELGLG